MWDRIADAFAGNLGGVADWVIDHWPILAVIGAIALLYVLGPLRWALGMVGLNFG